MQQVKIFVSDDSSEMEDKINVFLADNPNVSVLNIFATEIVSDPSSAYDNKAWATVYLLLKIP